MTIQRKHKEKVNELWVPCLRSHLCLSYSSNPEMFALIFLMELQETHCRHSCYSKARIWTCVHISKCFIWMPPKHSWCDSSYWHSVHKQIFRSEWNCHIWPLMPVWTKIIGFSTLPLALSSVSMASAFLSSHSINRFALELSHWHNPHVGTERQSCYFSKPLSLVMNKNTVSFSKKTMQAKQ